MTNQENRKTLNDKSTKIMKEIKDRMELKEFVTEAKAHEEGLYSVIRGR